MANEDIGDIQCAWCNAESPVRKRKDGKLYVMCPSCGQQFLNGPGGQDIILERANIWGASASKPAAKQETQQLGTSEPEVRKKLRTEEQIELPVSDEPVIDETKIPISETTPKKSDPNWFNQWTSTLNDESGA